jgi:uncharacterized membrane-anchored protein YjiN (DUF445 family)
MMNEGSQDARTQGANERSASLGVMRLAAGGLLAAMAGLFLVAMHLQQQAPAWGYARAFAEAALVGGLADWFAITALFRRPLGLPIPHTAIIPRNKDRIADTLGEFVAVNFLAPQVIGAHLQEQDLARALGRQLADRETAHRIAGGLVDALPGIADLLDDEVVSDFMRRQIAELSRDQRLPALIGGGLRALTEGGRHQVLLDAALTEGWRALEENEAAIRAQVRSQTSWVWRLISLDARASDALIGAIETTLQDISRDPEHPARRRVTEIIQNFALELEQSPDLRAHVERFVADVLAHPAVNAYVADLWRSLKVGARTAATAPASETRTALGDAIMRVGSALLEDANVQDSLNRRLRALLVEIADRHGREVGALISQTIRNWDTKTVVAKLEQSVGPDLQYIRINGTLIGGLIGLALHQATLLLS